MQKPFLDSNRERQQIGQWQSHFLFLQRQQLFYRSIVQIDFKICFLAVQLLRKIPSNWSLALQNLQKMFIRSLLILFVCEASWRFCVRVHPFTDWEIFSAEAYASLNLTICHLKLSRWKEFLNSVVAWTYAQNVFSNLANVVQLTHACQLFANEKNHFAFVKLSVSII